MLLEDITMAEFEEGLKRTRTVIIPFGSLEEHGLHLPLSTDTLQMYEIAKEAARRYPLFVAPSVNYGLYRSTRNHPGTVGLKGQTLWHLTWDLLEGFYQQGLRFFALVSGHAGQTHKAFILDAAEAFMEAHPEIGIMVATIIDLINLGARDLLETPGDSHAGEFETSLMLLLKPDAVKGSSPAEFPTFPGLILVRDKRRFWPGGVWGDPTKASQDKGQALFERLVEILLTKIKEMESV